MIALRRQALGDGFLDFLLLLRNERERAHPSEISSFDLQHQEAGGAARARREAADLATSPFTIGHIAVGCALSYLDFRFGDEDWRTDHPRVARWHRDFCERPSVRATEPIDDS